MNTNADTIASRIAVSMADTYKVSLSYCFEYPGVLYDLSTPDLTMNVLSLTDFTEMRESGSVNSGMIPKLTNGFEALKGLVSDVHICGIENLVTKERATMLTL